MDLGLSYKFWSGVIANVRLSLGFLSELVYRKSIKNGQNTSDFLCCSKSMLTCLVLFWEMLCCIFRTRGRSAFMSHKPQWNPNKNRNTNSVCVCVCFQVCVGWRGMWRCEVGSIPSPDELAGICKQWITRQRESIIQRTRILRPWPRGPFSNSESDFPKMSRGRGKERSCLEGVDDEKLDKKRDVCSHPHLSPSIVLSLSDQMCSVKMQKVIIRPSE